MTTASADVRAIFDSNKKYFPTPIQEFQFLDKYSRWIPEKNRRETWPETCRRALDFLVEQSGVDLSTYEISEMYAAMLAMEALPAMRLIQMAGPALARCHVGVYNCATRAIDSIDAFAELLYILMQGTGCSFSVEDRFVSRLPRIKKQRREVPFPYIIEDTTEGWCDALKFGMQRWFDGRDIEYNYSRIRQAGARLVTKGGFASGPQPLRELLSFTRSTVLAKQGKKLSTLDCHDIACYIGSIVHVGGVRRSAELSMSDPEDMDVAKCKSGEFWKSHPHRSMANNSAVWEEKPSAVEFMEEWLNLAKSGTGERGIFNRQCKVPKRRKRAVFVPNPCGEIHLRAEGQFCNLSICVSRPDDTLADLERKVRIATMFGTLQSMLTRFNYIGPQFKENCEEERLLGVDITGQLDCILLQHATETVLSRSREVAVETNAELAKRFGINPSVAVTCVKPSGNSSVLLGCSSGLHPRYAPFYIRRVRTGSYTPVARLLKDSGVPCFPETSQDAATATVLVFEFPVKSPDGAVTRNDLTAKDQFDYWLKNKIYYTEHNPSCTIYVDENEWLSLGSLVYENWDRIGGLSFLPKSNHIYPLAPNEEISKEEYERRIAAFPEIDYSKLVEYEMSDQTNNSLELACQAGQCEI